MNPKHSGGGTGGSIAGMIRKPIGIVLVLIVCLVLAGLSIASAISGQLTAAAVSAVGFVVIILILFMVNAIG